MNKFILIALFATAFGARNECAKPDELINSNFGEYKLKYMYASDYNKGDDLTKGKSIGFDTETFKFEPLKHGLKGEPETHLNGNGALKTGLYDTTFKIKGEKEKNGFRIFSDDESRILYHIGEGYYMKDLAKTTSVYGNFTERLDVSYETLLAYSDENELKFAKSKDDKKFYPALGVFNNSKSHISRTRDYANSTNIALEMYTNLGIPAKFCFVKATEEMKKTKCDKIEGLLKKEQKYAVLTKIKSKALSEVEKALHDKLVTEFPENEVKVSLETFLTKTVTEFLEKEHQYTALAGIRRKIVSDEVKAKLSRPLEPKDITQETVGTVLENILREKMQEEIDSFLIELGTNLAVRMQFETDAAKNNFAEHFKSKTPWTITKNDVENELEEYYKRNSVAKFGMTGVLACFLILQ